MTAPIEPTATPAPEPSADPPVIGGTQMEWDKYKPEVREAALRGDDLEVETPPKPVEETPPAEPQQTPPAEPPLEAEPPETPPAEEPAKPVAEPPAGEPPERLYAGQYKTVEEMEKAVLEKQGTIDRQGGELGELRKQTQPKPKPPPEDPEPEIDPFDPATQKAHDNWLLREVDRRNKLSEARIAKGLRQYEETQPIRDMVKQFVDDHPDITPEKRLTIGQHADNMARATGEPVSLEDAYTDLFGATTETPSTPQESPKGKETAEAIEAANAAPKTISDVPASPPTAASGPGSEVLSQAEWDALPEAEREKRMRDIPEPPKG